jgi:tRNA-splicing ligase RtcB
VGCVLKSHTPRFVGLPVNDKQLAYAPLGTQEAVDYIDNMSLSANFATVNHMLINQLVLEAFQEIIPGTRGKLDYFISHDIARREIVNDQECWVHRKGATRAFPANHFALKDTPFCETGRPIRSDHRQYHRDHQSDRETPPQQWRSNHRRIGPGRR